MINTANFNTILENSKEGTLLVVFSANWISQSTIVPIVTDKIIASKPELKTIMIDADRDEEVLLRFSVSELPTALIIHQGQIVAKHEGTFSKKQILDIVNSFT